MSSLNVFYSFRVRFLVLLACLLGATLSVQYYLNLRSEHNNEQIRDQQQRALFAGVALGVRAVTLEPRLIDIRPTNSFFDEKTGLIENVIVVDNNWTVYDSLDPHQLPRKQSNGSFKNLPLSEVVLPQMLNANELAEDLSHFNGGGAAPAPAPAPSRYAFALPVQTADQGRYYVVVVLKSVESSRGFLNQQAARPLVYTLVILLTATLLAAFLFLRLMRPIADISSASRRLAGGDFGVRIGNAHGRDEMSQLAERFNEMAEGLSHTRELETRLALAEQSAVVGRLASAIAHEIRNPLNYITLTLDHLRTAFPPADETKRALFEKLTIQLEAETARINNLITSFLNYSRPPSLVLVQLDLVAELRDALRLVEPQAAEAGIAVTLDLDADAIPLQADRGALRSVFVNLFINAVQAMKGAGDRLTVKVRALDNEVHVDVVDTGCGVSAENLPKLFEPYFSTKETGTGLGLAIVRKLVAEHGGRIDVQSAPDHGTTFSVTLPVASIVKGPTANGS